MRFASTRSNGPRRLARPPRPARSQAVTPGALPGFVVRWRWSPRPRWGRCPRRAPSVAQQRRRDGQDARAACPHRAPGQGRRCHPGCRPAVHPPSARCPPGTAASSGAGRSRMPCPDRARGPRPLAARDVGARWAGSRCARPTRSTGKCSFQAAAQSSSWTGWTTSSPMGRRPNAWRWPRSRRTASMARLRRARVERREYARRRGRLASVAGARRGPRRRASNEASTETPPGATRDRISLTASTASWSATTDSSSQVPAAIPSRSAPDRHRRGGHEGPTTRSADRVLEPVRDAPLAAVATVWAGRPASRPLAHPHAPRIPRELLQEAALSWAQTRRAPTSTMTWRSPRTPGRRRWGTPRPRSRISAPGWVPALTSTSSSPSGVGTGTRAPRAAWLMETPQLVVQLRVLSPEAGWGWMWVTTYRLPAAPPRGPASPSPDSRIWWPSSMPGGMVTRSVGLAPCDLRRGTTGHGFSTIARHRGTARRP